MEVTAETIETRRVKPNASSSRAELAAGLELFSLLFQLDSGYLYTAFAKVPGPRCD